MTTAAAGRDPRPAGWRGTAPAVLGVVAAHAVVLMALNASLQGGVSTLSALEAPTLEVVGTLELADAAPALAARPEAAAGPASGEVEPGVGQWVEVPAPPAAATVPAPPPPPAVSAPPVPRDAPSIPDPMAAPAPASTAEAVPPSPAIGPAEPVERPAWAAAAPATNEQTAERTTERPIERPIERAAPPPDLPAANPGPAVVPSRAGPAGTSPPGPPPFEWPPSTRLRYVLTGHYRGEIHGSAEVEWRREGDRYGVRLDIVVGPRFAPLLTRRIASDGRLGAVGLEPERYDELNQRAFGDPRTATVRFGSGYLQLATGRHLTAPIAVQDTASQFIQMAFRLATEPGLAEAGQVVAVPLALPRRLDVWIYDVMGIDRLATPIGEIEALHLRPRPLPQAGDTLSAEVWFAPRLRFLPVRIRIEQAPEVWIDLVIDKLPDLLAPRPVAAAVSPAASR